MICAKTISNGHLDLAWLACLVINWVRVALGRKGSDDSAPCDWDKASS